VAVVLGCRLKAWDSPFLTPLKYIQDTGGKKQQQVEHNYKNLKTLLTYVVHIIKSAT
jgi:hypothetical protein